MCDAMENFIHNLKCVMADRGIRQIDLAAMTGIKQPNISKILNGGEQVSLERGEKIALALGFPSLGAFIVEKFEKVKNCMR